MSDVYILGGAQTDFERNWAKEGKDFIALLREAMDDALSDVNITYDEIKELKEQNSIELFVGNFIGEKYVDQGHLGAFMTQVDSAFYGVPSARYEAACASSSVAIDAARSKIHAGDCDLAIVIGWELMKTVPTKEIADILGRAAFYKKEGKGIDFPFPKLFARLADETIKKYNFEQDQYLRALAKIACVNYENAKRNPKAQTRKWFMNEDQANLRDTESNPIVGGLLASSDCSQITDGAAVVVLASEKYLKEKNINNKPKIKGWGHRNAPVLFDDKIKESVDSKYILPWTRQAVVDAYKSSGLGVKDIDVFETHDCFTSSEFAAISCFGLCDPGEEIDYINNIGINFESQKPINPSGGLIGCGHPVGASGARMLLDCYKQVNNTAGPYQVHNTHNACMLNIGGSATTNYVFVICS